MSTRLNFQPHVRLLWSNKIDVKLDIQEQNGMHVVPRFLKVGSFTTYGKIMSFVLRFFFGVKFEAIKLDGRIHFVRPAELAKFKKNIALQSDNSLETLFDEAIKQAKAAVTLLVNPAREEPAPQPNPTPAIQREEPAPVSDPIAIEKPKIFVLGQAKMIVGLQALAQRVLGTAFQPVHDTVTPCDATVCFTPYVSRPQDEETESNLKRNLADQRIALVTCEYSADTSQHARSQFAHHWEISPNLHRFHILISKNMVNKCRWNDNEIHTIHGFLKNDAPAAV